MLRTLVYLLFLFGVAESYLILDGYSTSHGHFEDPVCISSLPDVAVQSEEKPDVTGGYWYNHMRASRCLCKKKRPHQALVLGCSYTEGCAVPDEQTYVWRLGELCQQYDFDNGGVGGFGPWQCYLHLQDILRQQKYDLVVYSSIYDHFFRNPITMYVYNDGTIAFLPYVEYLGGRWIEHKAKIVEWPGDRLFRTVNLLKNVVSIWRYGRPEWKQHLKQIRPGSVDYLEQDSKRYTVGLMRDYLAQRHIQFCYVTLDHHPEPWTRELHIPTCDACFVANFEMEGNTEYMVSADVGAHPNGATHNRWAHTIATWINAHGAEVANDAER